MEEEIFEIEDGMPENWEENAIFTCNAKGELVEVEIPDDIEEE